MIFNHKIILINENEIGTLEPDKLFTRIFIAEGCLVIDIIPEKPCALKKPIFLSTSGGRVFFFDFLIQTFF